MYLSRLAAQAASRRLPRRTVRLRLTLLYGGLFLISGAVLLAVTYVLVVNATDGVIFKGQDGSEVSVHGSHNGAAPNGGGQPPAVQTSGGSSGLSPRKRMRGQPWGSYAAARRSLHSPAAARRLRSAHRS